MNARPLPDFVIAGCAKSGTTAVADALDRHRRIVIASIKETDFFFYALGGRRGLLRRSGRLYENARPEHEIIDSEEKYLRQFPRLGDDHLAGDASPLYLMTNGAPDLLFRRNPDAKVLILLRNPTDVAFANFVNQVRDGAEDADMTQVDVVLDPSRRSAGDADPRLGPDHHPFGDHLNVPRYARHLPAWRAACPPGSLHVEVYEEMRRDMQSGIARIVDFLGVDSNEVPPTRTVNVSALPRSRTLARLAAPPAWILRVVRPVTGKRFRAAVRSAILRMNQGERPVLTERTRERLDAFYAPDRAYVRDMLGRQPYSWPE